MDDVGATVAQLLNECQLSTAVHKRAAKTLTGFRKEHPSVFAATLTKCLHRVMLTPKGNHDAERVVKFIAILATSRDPSASETETEEEEEFLEQLLTFLVSHTAVQDKHVRYRACQLSAEILERLTDDISEEIWESLKSALLGRMRDKAVSVRMQAARALARLQEAGEDGEQGEGDIVGQAYLQALEVERTKDVRKAVLGSMVVSDSTLAPLLDRTRDVHPEVRRVAFMVLAAKAEMAHLSIARRALVLRRGLLDRDSKARQACVDLLLSWLKACNSDAVELLRSLDVESHEEVGELVMRELISKGVVKSVEVAKSGGLCRSRDSALLDAEQALFWRMVCEDLQRHADAHGKSAATSVGTVATVAAAAAAEHLDALEEALPPTITAFFDLVAAHVEGGSERRYPAQQLLRLVPGLDLADGVGRQVAVNMLVKLMSQPPSKGSYACGGDETWERALVTAARHVFSSLGEFQSALLEAAMSLHIGEGASADSEAAEGGGAFDCSGYRQSLLMVVLMLESMSGGTGAGVGREHARRAMHALVLPAVQHQAPGVRADGLRCLGLCMLVGELEPAYVRLLRAALAHDEATCQAAACKALLDLTLCMGPTRMDSCLNVPGPASSGTGGAASEAVEVPLLKSFAALLDGPKANDALDEETNTRSLSVQGMAKLLMFDRAGDAGCGEAESALAKLLALFFTLDQEAEPQAAQCLTVFFPTYAASSQQHHSQLAAAVVPAMRLCAGAKLLPRLGQFLQMLMHQPQQSSAATAAAELARAELAASLLTEVKMANLACKKKAVRAAYLTACAKLAGALVPEAPVRSELANAPFADSVVIAPAVVAVSRKALHLLHDLLQTVAEKSLHKELGLLQERFQAQVGTDATTVLSEEEMISLAAEADRHLREMEALRGCFSSTVSRDSSAISSYGSAGNTACGSPTNSVTEDTSLRRSARRKTAGAVAAVQPSLSQASKALSSHSIKDVDEASSAEGDDCQPTTQDDSASAHQGDGGTESCHLGIGAEAGTNDMTHGAKDEESEVEEGDTDDQGDQSQVDENLPTHVADNHTTRRTSTRGKFPDIGKSTSGDFGQSGRRALREKQIA